VTTPPGADERRIRNALDARGVGYAPQPPADARARDWLDDLWADDRGAPAVPEPQPAVPPAPPTEPPETVTGTADEPRWDWRRLRHWPNARPAIAACIALAATVFPVPPGGYSAATTWAYYTHQVRANYGMGWGYAVGGGAFALAVWLVTGRGRRAGVLRLMFLAITAVGLTGFIHWSDIITLVTGAP
jgi:hypothetical protein